ncbi:hypothetical protein MMC13_004578 [Lambiella insularis]|nr:hypothetical protein [Lambiella insularis]
MLHRRQSKDASAMTTHGTASMTSEQGGQRPSNNDATRHSSPLKFFSSSIQQPVQTSDSQSNWTASFLTDLRSNRPARPSGARPPPIRHAHTTPIPSLEPPLRTSTGLSKTSYSTSEIDGFISPIQGRSTSRLSPGRTKSALSIKEHAGRPLAQQPVVADKADAVVVVEATPGVPAQVLSPATPIIPYVERGQRWMEKQEVRSLRDALEDMDLREEQRVHSAAQAEATDLVWEHRNPGVPYRAHDGPRDYKQHLRKGSHSRSQSIGQYGLLGSVRGTQTSSHRSASGGSNSTKSSGNASLGSRVSSGSSSGQDKADPVELEEIGSKSEMEWDSPERKGLIHLRLSRPPTRLFSGRKSSGSRSRASNAESRPSLFRNPKDQIYEEPEELGNRAFIDGTETTHITPLKPKNRNLSGKFAILPIPEDNKTSKYEIHKNPPSQSRDPSYVRNFFPQDPKLPSPNTVLDKEELVSMPVTKDGLEIRSDEIRAATSMRLKDRSPKLPQPTVVSNRPGRPIVSFDREYKPREVELKQEHSLSNKSCGRDESTRALPKLAAKTYLPSINSAPAIPTITVLESPTIVIEPEPSISGTKVSAIPSISVPASNLPGIVKPITGSSGRPLPSPANRSKVAHGHRPIPHHSFTAPVKSSQPHWTPVSYQATAQCAACALPISGRIVSAASQRFHPACFSCFQCGELLECVAFYPEPDDFRTSRLGRIKARLNNESLAVQDAQYTQEDDGDDGLRFYCHLDFHENFSPRCRSCKTPIEGEVVVACGGEWHVGHFFCAECGDPFDASMPFVEKDGFAWCVDCHGRRFSGKCAGCRKPVIDMVVKALGKEWHEGCFCCKV